MVCATRLSVFIALAALWGVRGQTVQLEVSSTDPNGAKDLCLAVVPQHGENVLGSVWHLDGLPVAARPCADVRSECGADINCGLSHFWRLDKLGALVSHVSGKCLAVNAGNVSGPAKHNCKHVHGGWLMRPDGGLESLSQPLQCLSLTHVTSVTPTHKKWRSLELRPCSGDADMAKWSTKAANLVTYPVISGWETYNSQWYDVTVSIGSYSQSSFVYYSVPLDGQPLQGQSNSYTTFSFHGEAVVTVKRKSGAFKEVVLRPLSLNLAPVLVEAGTIQFTVPSPGGKISVEFDDDWQTDPLFIFADPLETDVPSQGKTGIVYYEPGLHYVNNPILLASNQRVYIAGGAVLFANNADQNMFDSGWDSSLSNIKITGRGIISGKLSTDYPYLITLCGNDHVVEGITMVEAPEQSHLQINAPWYCDGEWTNKAGGALITNVKLLSWNFADGIYAGARSMVSNSFTKVNDDGVKPFESDSVCENNVHWAQGNGWPIMIAWLTEGYQSNIIVRDSTILHDGHAYDFPVASCDPCYDNQAMIGAVHGGSGTINNVVIDNIVMEGQVLRPVWIGIDKSFWGLTGAGVITNFKLSNIRVLGGAAYNNQVVNTFGSNQVSGIEFYNYEVWGKVAENADDACLEVIPGSLDSVVVKSEVPSPPPTPPGAAFVFQYRRDHSKCLDMAGNIGYVAQGSLVQLWHCIDGADSQRWIWDKDAHAMRSASDTNLCLDIPGGDTNSKTMWMWECNGAPEQHWDYDPATGGIFHCLTDSCEKGVCINLDNNRQEMGMQLGLYACNERWVQQSWDRSPLGSTPTTKTTTAPTPTPPPPPPPPPTPTPTPTPTTTPTPPPTPPPSSDCPGGNAERCILHMCIVGDLDFNTCAKACLANCPEAAVVV